MIQYMDQSFKGEWVKSSKLCSIQETFTYHEFKCVKAYEGLINWLITQPSG